MCGPSPSLISDVPLIFNLRLDPYERANITSNTYYDWLLDHAFLAVPAQAYVGRFLATFRRLSAPPEGGELLDRSGAREVAEGERRLT